MKNDVNHYINDYANDYGNEYANAYTNDYTNAYGNYYTNAFENEHARAVFYNHGSGCYEFDGGMQLYCKNECLENDNAIYDDAGFEGDAFYDPVYESNGMKDVGFDDGDVIYYSEQKMKDCLCESNTCPPVLLNSSSVSEPLGLDKGLGMAVGMQQAEELQKPVGLYEEYKVMDECKVMDENRVMDECKVMGEKIKEDGKEENRNMINQSEIAMTTNEIVNSKETKKENVESSNEMASESKSETEIVEKINSKETNAKNDNKEEVKDEKETILVRDVEIFTNSKVKIKAILKVRVIESKSVAKENINEDANVETRVEKIKNLKKMNSFISSAFKSFKKCFSCFGSENEEEMIV